MRYEYTSEVRHALAGARDQAVEYGHGHVGTEHILLSLLEQGGAEVQEALAARGIGAEALREAVASGMEPGDEVLGPTELPYTGAAKGALHAAMQSARERGSASDRGRGRGRQRHSSSEVSAVDLLDAVLDAPAEAVRAAIRDVAGSAGGSGGHAPEADETAGVAIDDASDRSIYEQIVEQIRERIAVGDLESGERLPPVRRMADRLDIAPGTVARAYTELERLGLVVTGGARGTRVAERERAAVPDEERAETLVGLLRPVAVAAFHLGATARELRSALETAMQGIFEGTKEPDSA